MISAVLRGQTTLQFQTSSSDFRTDTVVLPTACLALALVASDGGRRIAPNPTQEPFQLGGGVGMGIGFSVPHISELGVGFGVGPEAMIRLFSLIDVAYAFYWEYFDWDDSEWFDIWQGLGSYTEREVHLIENQLKIRVGPSLGTWHRGWTLRFLGGVALGKNWRISTTYPDLFGGGGRKETISGSHKSASAGFEIEIGIPGADYVRGILPITYNWLSLEYDSPRYVRIGGGIRFLWP